jgi:ketosteroid isomerase-like protein
VTPSTDELIRTLCDALNAGDVGRAIELTDPDVVQYGTVGGMDQGMVLRGQQAVIDYWNDVSSTWASLRYEPERIIDSGEVVVVLWRETARSARSDLEVRSDTATIFKVREGRILELRGYMDRDEALAAADVAE